MDIINIPMGHVIRFLNGLVGGQYLFALFLFAIVIEIILLPFGIKQQKNSIKQAKLRPMEMAIRKKYAGRDDNVTKQKIQEEIQALYQKEGYSPFSGCLPLLIQFPIIIALYNIVLNPLRYICQLSDGAVNGLMSVAETFTGKTYDAARTIDLMDDIKRIITEHGADVFKGIEGFAERISGASDLPNLEFLGLNLAETPSFTSGASMWLMIIPVLTFVSYFFSMKMTRKLSYQSTTADDPATGCSNKMMDLMMPLMSVWICFMVPAAIGVYWIFKSLLGVLKQWILKKAMPVPTFTEEDYKAAEKEYGATKNEKSAGVKKSGGPKPGVRSLHHIDDEDFEDTAAAAAQRKKALEEAEAEAKQKEAEKKPLIAPSPIKNDTRPERKEKDKKNDKDKKEETEVTETAENESSDQANNGENN